MELNPAMPSDLPADAVVAALGSGATVLTATPFTAQWLTRAEDDRRRALGGTTWQAPAIAHWGAWTQTLWQTCQLRGLTDLLLLNPTQERAVARECVAEVQRDDSESASLNTLAELSLAAWHQLAPYGSWQQIRPVTGQIDLDYFRRWAAAFSSRCRTERLLSPALLEAELARLVLELPRAGTAGSPLPAEVLLAGFERASPAQRGLQEALEQAGVRFMGLPRGTPTAAAYLVEAAEPSDELLLAARWLKDHLDRNPSARLAVLTCSLDAQRAAIEQTFREHLTPADAGIFGLQQPVRFELAGGTPLIQKAPVRVALNLLQWLDAPLPLDRISAVLLSPAFGSQGRERAAVAAFDAYELRRLPLLQPELSLDALRQLLRMSPRAAQLAGLRSRLEPLIEAAERVIQRNGEPILRTPGDWAERIHRLLRDAGWAGARGGTSLDFQLRRRWESSLDQLASLDFAETRLTFEQARRSLMQIIDGTRFTNDWTAASVQVLDVAEAAGCQFDAVWVLRAGDRTWLPRPTVSPLLPRSLTRELGLPGADSEAHLGEAQALTGRVLTQAPEVVFSYAREIDGGEQQPSPLLEALGLQVVTAAELFPPQATAEPVALTKYLETFAPELPHGTRVRGGTDVLRAQAACSFQAFASYRLGSTELEAPELGWGPKERGIVLHRALELIWQIMESREGLLAHAADPEAFRSLIRTQVDAAFERMRGRPKGPWEERYLETEATRLQTVLDDWLGTEALRLQDFTVRNRELRLKDQPVGPLLLTLAVDRIDEVGDGLLLIDYKSGAVKASMWEGERLDQPQLPLYAVLQEEPVAGVAFASLRVGNSKFIGYGPDMNPPASLPYQHVEQQIPEWRDAVVRLAEAFATGLAHANPKEFPGTCQHCGQRLLCRIDPIELDDSTEQEAEVPDPATTGASLG